MNNYNSYLVRQWSQADERRANESEAKGLSQVFDIEHIQSGRRTRLASLSEAQIWVDAISLESRKEQPEDEQG